ncbi:MAG: hypothetical protein H7301_01840 [Cryobacterium sp.]|nr:hypothetical protein [Oligoflexia bacterium]
MPELPEVETSRRRIEKALKGKVIAEVIPDFDDHIVFDQASAEEVKAALEGAKVLGSARKGKYLWLKLDRKPWPVFHLGMTGDLEVSTKKGFVKAWGGPKHWEAARARNKETRILPYCRLRIVTKDGSEVAFTDPRRFGRIRLAEDPENEAPISKLGFDPLLKFPTALKLGEILEKRRAPIKAVLLDQGLFAGVGNWIADEVLFQSGISPHRLASSLKAVEVGALRTKLLSIIRKAVSVGADYDHYPASWLFHYRWGKAKEAVTHRKEKITHDTVGGRTTAWVPTRQK